MMRLFRKRLVLSVAMMSVAAVSAGCSADATRLQDGFYTGAIPKASVGNQQIAAAPSAPAAPSYGTQASETYAAATPSVSRSSLPPPPASSYGNGGSSYEPPAQQAAVSSAPIGQSQIGETQASRAMASTQPVRSTGGARSASVTVESGDSLLGIARRNGVSISDLRAANNLSGDNIRIGQSLVIPGGSAPAAAGNTRVASLGAPPTTLQAQAAAIPAPRAAPANRPMAAAPAAAQAPHTPAAPQPVATAQAPAATMPAAPKAADTTVASAAPAPATTVKAEEEKQEASLAPASTGIDQFRWPVQGRVVKNFGDKVGSRRNDGLNISVPRGTPVKAAENGVVIYAGEGLKEFGKTVLIKHDNGLVTVYGHADDILVQRGSTVKRGQEIAKAGMTGDTDSPMLHFEVRKDSSPVNPMTYLR
ncbi:M23 family metallopeptidase [Aureimonas sp. ME7]|uniref:M23 family metallopeptidase n=1 Tax=Aureimonas sp. ME7 TaxID=2744252 RepID=UPI001FCEB800|nr:M23 family metallopeptidase [Aureimonas sp. ME7]